MPEQLTFELAEPAPPAFDNFLAGRNEELRNVLARAAEARLAETGVVIWGPPGVGKSHLLAATARAAQAAGRVAQAFTSAEAVPGEPVPGALVAVDDLHRASAEAQGNLFTVYNALAATGGHLVVATAMPPAHLGLRPDLRTRLGHGLVFEVLALDDAAKPAALAHYAASRGFRLDRDVIAYLLAHYPRDMKSLMQALAALDRWSLATQRPITVPFVRQVLGSR